MISYNPNLVGDSLRELRKKNHMTQFELAEKLDVSYIHYSQIEQGRRKMSVDLLFRMISMFDVDANLILGLNMGKKTANSRLVELTKRLLDLESIEQEYILKSWTMLLDEFLLMRERMDVKDEKKET